MANVSPELGTAALNSDLCKSSVLFIKNRVLKEISLTYSSALFRNVAWLSVCGAQKKNYARVFYDTGFSRKSVVLDDVHFTKYSAVFSY